MKSTEEVRRDYVENSHKARQQNQYQSMLNSCSPADQEAIKVLSFIDDQSGGQIDRLVAVYKAIKSNSK